MSAFHHDLQLVLWSQAGDDAASSRTYRSTKAAIEADSALSGRSVEVYLQGSYANSTNISGDSDVDIVVQSSATFFHSYRREVPQYQRDAVASSHIPATYYYSSLRDDVLRALRVAFPGRVSEGNKAIKIAAGSGSGEWAGKERAM